MCRNRNWSVSEVEYLESRWGDVSIPAIANYLGRSVMAIKMKATKLGLGAVLENGDYVTLNQLLKAVTGSESAYSYKIISWIKNRRLPVHTKKVINCSFRVVYIDEFWDWAEKNRSFIDFSKMEPLILGKEPEWVAEQRRKDYISNSLTRKDPWTSAEDDKLRCLLKQQKYGYSELSEILCRSEGAIQRRCIDLSIKDRPVKADTHGKSAEWTDEMYKTVAEGIKNGDSYALIGKKVGKSEKAVRGKVYYKYLTENADKVREMIAGGSWGDGAPQPRVKQAVTLSNTRTECRKQLSVLAGLLKYRMNELGYEPYWQRYMCMKWDDFKGCSARCDNCDDCTEFVRIRPQYCARCGQTFIEREENTFCPACRQARKKQAQKKWCIVNKKRGA